MIVCDAAEESRGKLNVFRKETDERIILIFPFEKKRIAYHLVNEPGCKEIRG